MDFCYIAVRTDGKVFGGKGGTQTGYRNLGNLKNAMAYRDIDYKSNYKFFKVSFDEQLNPKVEVVV